MGPQWSPPVVPIPHTYCFQINRLPATTLNSSLSRGSTLGFNPHLASPFAFHSESCLQVFGILGHLGTQYWGTLHKMWHKLLSPPGTFSSHLHQATYPQLQRAVIGTTEELCVIHTEVTRAHKVLMSRQNFKRDLKKLKRLNEFSKLQNTRLISKTQLFFYTLAMNKLEKNFFKFPFIKASK